MDSFYGRVWAILHRSEDHYIFTMEPDSERFGKKVTCKGHIFGILQLVPGLSLQLFGQWVHHEKYGRQFSLHGWSPWAASNSSVDAFLGAGLGLVRREHIEAIVAAFGVETYNVLATEPDRLRQIPLFAADPEAATRILEAWMFAQTSADLSALFSDHDVNSAQMNGVFKAFGVDAKSIIQGNPYRLLEVEQFQFNKVDDIARRLGVQMTDPRRYEGAVLWVLREAANAGHLCVRRGDIPTQLVEAIRTSETIPFQGNLPEELNKAVVRLEERGGIKVDPHSGVYLPWNFAFERNSAYQLVRFMTPVKLDVDVASFLTSYATLHQIVLSDAQQQAVTKLVNNRVVVITGLPGTGKTTLVKTIVNLFRLAGVTFTLMAPTGIASKRLASVTGHPAGTIHRTLGYDGNKWGSNRDNKYNVGAVIVDEVSMVDQELFFRIMDALDPETILVLVGDDAQLPSVGPGNVLRELIHCAEIPTIRLTQIFRQAETSDIILNSHRINRGEQIIAGNEASDFRFISITDEDKIADLIVQMAIKLKSRDANFQVLAPKYEGTVGVKSLNDRLRETLNPPAPEKREFAIGTLRFREGDRLMVIQNDYTLGVYNGDMGKLISITPENLVVRIHGAGEDGLDMMVEFPRKDVLNKLRLAYAITVHKSQGSEFDTVIFPIVRAQGRMLQRNLFYTAITRAKKRVWLLGDSMAVQKAIANDRVLQRNTGFGRAISQSFLDARVVVDGVGVEVPAHVERRRTEAEEPL